MTVGDHKKEDVLSPVQKYHKVGEIGLVYADPKEPWCWGLSQRGPWRTKAGGELMVSFAMPIIPEHDFLSWDEEELEKNPLIRKAVRSYESKGAPQDSRGSSEFHRVRKEYIFCTGGKFEFVFHDVWGGKRVVAIGPNEGVFLPNFILHSYKAVGEGRTNSLKVFANTWFPSSTDPKKNKEPMFVDSQDTVYTDQDGEGWRGLMVEASGAGS